MHNGFWELRLDRRMPTIGHLTTWPDLEEVRRTRDRRGIKRNEPSEAARRRSGCRSAKRTQRTVGGMEAVLRNEPNEAGSGFRGRLTRSSSARLIDVELLRLNLVAQERRGLSCRRRRPFPLLSHLRPWHSLTVWVSARS